ncbi:MAG TPA: class III poly(R)-hydroxyalkanoic acid synthase subunit PhaE [Rhodanobacteraceae bacterium]
MSNGPKNEWMDQWQALSRQYWNAWQDLTRETSAKVGSDPSSAPWHEGFEQWARMFGGPGKQSETIERVLASARSFTAFAQSMIAAATAARGVGAPSWTDALRDGFKMPDGAALFSNPVAEALREISGQGVKSFEQMMQGMTPGMAPGFDPAREVKSWLRVPAFGFLREHQEHYQKMAVALIEYQEQTARYNALIMKSSVRAFELFESKLAAREEPGRQIDSLRALYDLWVDSAEEAYAEIALSQEFREVYGSLVNAQMRVRSQMQQEVERIATDFGMPTRSELDSIGQRLHDLRRDLRNGSGSASSNLAREVEDLRREVAELKAAMKARGAEAPKAAVKKPQARKRPRTAPPKKAAKPAVASPAENLVTTATVKAIPIEAVPPAPRPRAQKSTPRARVQPRMAGPHAQRPTSPPRTKKSVAKVAHSPSRSGRPVPSFAERIAEFARTARTTRKARHPVRLYAAHRSTSRGGR